jgi:AraC-like DNA-binding protein
MHKTTLKYAETTIYKENVCVLSDTLNAMRIGGSLLISEEYVSPWAVAIPEAAKLGGMLNIAPNVQVIAFHYVKRGFIELIPIEGKPLMIEAGEMAICFGGTAHQISQHANQPAVAVETILTQGNNPFKPDSSNKARSTAVMCGVFMMRNLALNPMFASLPPILHVSASQVSALHHLPDVLHWMSREIEQKIQCTFVIERLLELLCAEVLRAHLESATSESAWFQAVNDPVVGRAMSMIHSNPSVDWSVNRLAQNVAMSPSRFAARFAAALGDSPMAYVTKWRMNVAGRLLSETQQGIGEIAANLGYENVAAFGRTFKRHLGLPPATWRQRQNRI